jgi:hypothetical protein
VIASFASTNGSSACRAVRRAGVIWVSIAALAFVIPQDALALGGSAAGTAITAAPNGYGYGVISATGGQYNYGASRFSGSLAGSPLAAPVVDAASVPGRDAVWMAGADGGVFALGGAAFYGSLSGKPLNQPVTAIVASPSGKGYLLVARDGGTFAFGDYRFPGSLAGIRLNAPIADAIRAAGGGLWMVGEDGGVFALSAPFYGSATSHGNSVAPRPAGSPADGSNGGMVAVACPGRGRIVVAAQIGPSVARLLAAANGSGLRLCGSGARSVRRQEELRAAHCGGKANVYDARARCRPPTALPGRSMHEKGLAIDFDGCGSRSTRCFQWLKANAAAYGLINLPSEPWHWSTNGR